jgi:predicted glycosyltransferase
MLNPRIALYSPGMVGLGHMRRNLLLVRRFAAKYRAGSFLMITEAREAGIFDFPENVDCLSLPALRKDADGNCSPRRLRIDLPELVRLRRDVIAAALSQFSPGVLIVDHLPRGALGELAPSLEMLKHRGTQLVLGLRDILEEPETVRAEWARAGNHEAIEKFYDAIWIYGDPAVFDLLSEYDFPRAVAAKARFTGYLNPAASPDSRGAGDAETLAVKVLDGARFILCQVGGGQDGMRIAQAFVDSEMPPDHIGVLLTGPFMPASEREALCWRASRQPSKFHVLDLISEPAALLSLADRVITMGGYNSVCEVVSHDKHALIIPRTAPRREQLIRARKLAELGLIEWLDPEKLCPAAISEWLQRPSPTARVRRRMDMKGLERASRYLKQVLERSPSGLRESEPVADSLPLKVSA